MLPALVLAAALASAGAGWGSRPAWRSGVQRQQQSPCLLDEEECPLGLCREPSCDGGEADVRRCRCRPGLARDMRTRNCRPPSSACPNFSFSSDTSDPRDPAPPNPRTGDLVSPATPACEATPTKYIKNGGQTLLYRLYKELDKDHMLTRYISEVSTAIQFSFYGFEGPIGRLAGSANDILVPCPELKPLFRMYRPGLAAANHFYTTKPEQVATAKKFEEGYWDQGIAGYCTKPAACGATLRLYRFYDSTNIDHFYTTDPSDLSKLNSGGQTWVAEGIECYVWPL